MSVYRGAVKKGEGRGKALGFPTANIPLRDASIRGIFAARAWAMGKEYSAAVYADQRRKLLEAYLLNFSGELYGEMAEVEVVKKIRDIRKFASLEELKAQIVEDVKQVRQLLEIQ